MDFASNKLVIGAVHSRVFPGSILIGAVKSRVFQFLLLLALFTAGFFQGRLLSTVNIIGVLSDPLYCCAAFASGQRPI